MAATIATALAQVVEAGGLGLPAYRDAAPDGEALPFVVITEGITIVPDNIQGDAITNGDTCVENVQVDLWEPYIDDTLADGPKAGEVYERQRLLMALLNGTSLPNAPRRVYSVRVGLGSRVRDTDANTVRTRLSVDIKRDL